MLAKTSRCSQSYSQRILFSHRQKRSPTQNLQQYTEHELTLTAPCRPLYITREENEFLPGFTFCVILREMSKSRQAGHSNSPLFWSPKVFVVLIKTPHLNPNNPFHIHKFPYVLCYYFSNLFKCFFSSDFPIYIMYAFLESFFLNSSYSLLFCKETG